MNQALSHSFGESFPISPKPIYSLCIAAHSRFAKAENVALSKIHGEAIAILGGSASLFSFATSSLPPAYIGDRPLIECLLDSLSHTGGLFAVCSAVACSHIVQRAKPDLVPGLVFYNIYMHGQNVLLIFSSN